MKKYGTLIALAVAVIFGIIAVVLANKWMSSRTPSETVIIKEQVPLTKVVVAGQDLDIGSQLTAENMTLADWPKANVPKGAFHKIEDIQDRVVVTKVVAGIPVVAAELAAPGSGVGLVAKIDPGMRAITISVNEVVGVAGFILPNTYVDVVSLQGKNKSAKMVLERVEVLAIAQATFVEEGKARVVSTVTLELSPKDAMKLAETTHKGPIQLLLRNPAEDIAQPEPPKKKSTRRYTAAPKPAQTTFKVELIQGDRKPENYKFKYSDQ